MLLVDKSSACGMYSVNSPEYLILRHDRGNKYLMIIFLACWTVYGGISNSLEKSMLFIVRPAAGVTPPLTFGVSPPSLYKSLSELFC